jgi:serine/threonine protein kinase
VILAGRYRIDGSPELVHVGGVVVTAHDMLLDVKVEAEIFRPERFENAQAVAKFIGHVRALSQIESEHMRRILEVGLYDGSAYQVKELAVHSLPPVGRYLAAWVQRHGALPVERAVDFVIQACDALVKAHGRGIVHQDIKPSNLFAVERSGVAPSVKVDGWDLSKSLGSVSTTEEGQIAGTPVYMPPERFQGAGATECDQRSDIWSLGITLCELVTGGLPFKTASLGRIMCTIVSDAPLPFPDSFPHLPQGLQAIILKCLERDRKRRYQSVADLVVALMEFGSERSLGLAGLILAVALTSG